jgi:phosphoserine phosphatase RsbU/P
LKRFFLHRSQRNAEPDWKQLLQLSEQLANQATPDEQCRLIQQITSHFFSADVRVWLAYPAYPLWGSLETETLPRAEATALAHATFKDHTITFAYANLPGPIAEALPTSAGQLPNAIALPLMTRGIMLGVIQMDAGDGQVFNEKDIIFAEGITLHAAIAMESTRQEAIKNWYLEQLTLVRSVSAQIASFSHLEDLYAHVTGLIQETFQYDYVAILTLDEHKNELIFRGSASRDQTASLPSGFSVKPGEGIIGTVGKSGAEIVSPDVAHDQRYRFLENLPLTRSEAALPLKIENRILGVLDFQCDQIDAFQESDMLVLRSLADNIALAIESKYLTYGLERRAEQISSVFEISHALTSVLDLDQLLNDVVQLIQNRFGYPFIHNYTVHPGRRLVIYQTGIGERSTAAQTQHQHYHLDDPKGIISWVARNGKTFFSNDTSKEPLYLPPDFSLHETRSELTVPLIHGEHVLGVLDIQSRTMNAFDENDQSLFEALAAPIAVAMGNANLYRSEQWRRKVAESFRDVAHLISENLPLNQLLDVILEKLENNLPCDASAIWLLDENPGKTAERTEHRLRLAATRNITPESIFSALQEKSVQEMLERSMDSQQPLIRKPEEPLGPLGAALGFEPNYSSIAALMGTDNQPLGVLTLAHHQDGRYGSEAQAITATFASYASVAIQNSRLYNQIQEQALISTMLLQVAEASQTIMTIEDLLTTMVRMTRLLVGVRKCGFLIWDDSLQAFRMMSWYGFELGSENQRIFSAHLPGLAKLAQERTTLTIDDPGDDLNLPEISLAQGTIVMLPLLVRGNVIGAFLVGLQMAWATGIESGFDPKALAILQGIAHQTGMTIDNLRLLEARQEEAYVTAALLQVAQAVVSSNDLNDTLDTIIHLLPILVGINTCIIYLWDAINHLFRPTQVYAENRREEEVIINRPFAPGEYSLLDAVRQNGEMHLSQIPDPTLPFLEWTSLPSEIFDQLTVQTNLPQGDWVLGYPLSLQKQVFGVLVVREANASSAFWERRLEILHGIAQQTSLAIQNDLFKQELVQTERIEREIQLARQIQETFLPETLPQLNRWELDLRWETAREVGGDFYDIFKLADNRVGLVIADVSDKGIPAALYMTVARTLIRANAAGGQTPAEVLEEVNKLLLNDSADAMFITAVYAILNLESGELLYANAGHNRPLLFRRNKGQIEQLPKGGTALGVLDELKLVNHKINIYPGESLILYTDGVTDALSPEGTFFGEPRLFSLITAHGTEPIREMLEYLDDALIEFRRGLAPMDDITLLAIQRDMVRRKSRGKKRQPAANNAPTPSGE